MNFDLTAPGAAPTLFTVTTRVDGTVLFNWGPPPSDQLNGVLTSYELSCVSSLGMLNFQYGPNVVSSDESGFGFAARYECSLLATTAPGPGPSANSTFVTCEHTHTHTHTHTHIFT